MKKVYFKKKQKPFMYLFFTKTLHPRKVENFISWFSLEISNSSKKNCANFKYHYQKFTFSKMFPPFTNYSFKRWEYDVGLVLLRNMC